MTPYASEANHAAGPSSEATVKSGLQTSPVVFPDGSAVWCDDAPAWIQPDAEQRKPRGEALSHATPGIDFGVGSGQVCHHHYHYIAGGRWLMALALGMAIALLAAPLVFANWPALASLTQSQNAKLKLQP